MYTEEQRRDHIAGLQQDLRVIQGAQDAPVPTISGEYDSLTENAVRRFQQQHQLPVTGKTDLTTWDSIVAEANSVRSRTALPLAVRVFPNALYQVEPGDHGRFLYILQGILNGLAEAYHNFAPLDYTGVYDKPTEQAVLSLQYAAGLPPTGKLDAETWNSLAHLYAGVVPRRKPVWMVP